MRSSEDKKEGSPVLSESLKKDPVAVSQSDGAPKGTEGAEGESSDGKGKPASSGSKLTATAKEWKPNASATAFQPRNTQPPAVPQAGYGVPFGQEHFFGGMPPMMMVSSCTLSSFALHYCFYMS